MMEWQDYLNLRIRFTGFNRISELIIDLVSKYLKLWSKCILREGDWIVE